MRLMIPALACTVPLAFLFAAPACIIPSITQNTPDAGSTAAASSSSDAGTTAATQGASCTAVTSSISLCEYISSCPTLVLPAQFTTCGFYIHGDAIDPECLCDSHYLCPIGKPTTCAQAATAASGDTTYDSVCQQSVTGGCTDLTAGGSTTTAACQSCVNSCDNVPSCIDACGC